MMPTAHGSDSKSCEKLPSAPSCRVTHATLMPRRRADARMSGNVRRPPFGWRSLVIWQESAVLTVWRWSGDR